MNQVATGTTSVDQAVPNQSPDGTGSTTGHATSDNMARYVSSVGGVDATPYTIRHSDASWTPDWTYIPSKWPSHWVPPHGWVPDESPGVFTYEEWWSSTPTSVKDAKRLIAEHEASIERLMDYIEEQRRELEEPE